MTQIPFSMELLVARGLRNLGSFFTALGDGDPTAWLILTGMCALGVPLVALRWKLDKTERDLRNAICSELLKHGITVEYLPSGHLSLGNGTQIPMTLIQMQIGKRYSFTDEDVEKGAAFVIDQMAEDRG